MQTPTGTVIIIGASMAGLMAARAVSPHAEKVIIVERDHLPTEPIARRGVPQGRHAHVMLGAGQNLLDEWFPGFSEELKLKGAVALYGDELVWHQGGGYRRPADVGFVAMSMSRPALEHELRRRLLAQCPTVEILDGTRVDDIVVDGAAVVGVRAAGRLIQADLVVDCSGRSTRAFAHLARAGYREPAQDALRVDVAYRTRVLPRRAATFDETSVVLVGDGPHRRVGTMVPVEGDRWIVTTASFHGDTAPFDDIAFERFAYSLPSHEIASVVAAAARGGVERHAIRGSRRRRVENAAHLPAGFIALGDALCAFNPIYGQGMAVAALEARLLGDIAERHALGTARFVRAYNRGVARIVDVPWRMAAAGDFLHPKTTGDRPVGTGIAGRYLEHVLRACTTSPAVSRQMMLVQNLLASPASLATPAMLVRVLAASRRAANRSAVGAHAAPARRPRVSLRGMVALQADVLSAGALSRATR